MRVVCLKSPDCLHLHQTCNTHAQVEVQSIDIAIVVTALLLNAAVISAISDKPLWQLQDVLMRSRDDIDLWLERSIDR